MGIFGNLFGSKKLTVTDPDFGGIKSFHTRGNTVCWKLTRMVLGFDIEIIATGDQNGISEIQRQILIKALNNETELKADSEKALQQQFENAEMEFISIEKHFDLKAISVNDEGFEISYQEKEGQNYYFNVQFENYKQIGVSIDG
ncbi:hypothetical protein N9B82_02505 [Saprospiraceae bacterium]|nr:hypothetical protein [Saprospiraceae bacterium]